jgi:putative membrane protein
MRRCIISTSPVFLVYFAGPALADPGDGFGHMMWGGGYGIFGGLTMLVFWGLVIGLIVLAIRGFSGRAGTGSATNATDILRGRFARGEIDDEEYERRKAKLDN